MARRVAIGAGTVVALIAAGHLVAWLAGAMTYRGLSAITMKTNTSLCLLLLGISLTFIVASNTAPARRFGRACAALAFIIGILTLGENLFDWDLGIDQLLAKEPSGAMGMMYPNRIGTPASFGIVLLGFALLIVSRRDTRWLLGAQAMALGATLIGLLTVVGHVYGVQWLFGVARVTAIALPTATSLLLLGLGVACARASQGLMAQVTSADPGGAVIRRLVLPVLLLPVALGWLRLLGERSRLFDTAMGTALLMVLFVVVLAVATYLVGRRVSHSSAELERQRGTLAVTLASIGDAVLACNTAGEITYVNPVAASLTGWSSAAARSQPVESVFQIINEQTRAPAASIVARVLQEKRVVALENHTALIARDGREIPIEDSAAPIVDAQGTVLGVVLVFHDVAEKRRAQAALRESERRVRLKLESILSPTGDVSSLDLADLIDVDALRSQIESFYRLAGIPVGIIDIKGKVLIGVGWQDVCTKFHRVNPESCQHCIESDTQLSAGVPEGEHRVYKCKNNMWDVATPIVVGGRHLGNVFTGQFFFDDEKVDREVFRGQAKRYGFGEEAYLAAIDRVPRVSRSAVQEGMAFYARLAHMLSKLSYGNLALARTLAERDRTEQALQQANTQLAEADLRKNEFLAVLSHELRNPLAPITNSLYILDHAPPSGEQASRAKQVIARQVEQLSHLVNDLLDVTRITRNKIRLSKERLDLNEVARRAIEDNRSLFDDAEVRLELAPAPRPVHVLADRTRVAQIIGNLLQNAAKFTHKGGCTRVFLSAEGGEAVIRIVDDGVGIAPDILARLFQPFMQADHTLDRSKGGLGLGLAVIKGLVELHGGGISARSEGPGKGAEFLVRLPLDIGEVSKSAAGPLPSARVRRRILIIEDNVDAAESLRAALELCGYAIEVANNGPDGLAKARATMPEVVLCDIGLPGMDGYDVARTLRGDAAFKATHLVALSGYALPEDLQRASEAGFERHLAKPPSLEKLEELLGSLSQGAG
jgi:two-component system CheB/CheR fusion protein